MLHRIAFQAAAAMLLSIAGGMAHGEPPATWLGADVVLQELEKAKVAVPASEADVPFVAQMQASMLGTPSKHSLAVGQQVDGLLRSKAGAAERATNWVNIYARIRQPGTGEADGDGEHEFQNNQLMQRLFGALPPPQEWPSLASALRKRYALKPAVVVDDTQAAALSLAALLTNDDASLQVLLLALAVESPAQPASPERKLKIHAVRERVARHGGNAAVAALFEEEMHNAEKSQDLEVPDLVTLVGGPRAEAMLQDLLARDLRIESIAGEDTHKLARKLAFQRMEQLPRPQWILVAGPESAPLYEAMQRKFPEVPGTEYRAWNPMRIFLSMMIGRELASDSSDDEDSSDRKTARVAYLQALVVQGRTVDAVVEYKALASDEDSSLLWKLAIEIERSGNAESLLPFVEGLLDEHGDQMLWQRYIELASRVGQQERMLARVRSTQPKATATSGMSTTLATLLIDALLSADKTDEAAREILTRLDDTVYPKLARAQLALKLAQVGRLLGNEEWKTRGLSVVSQAIDGDDSYSPLLSGYVRELRFAQRFAEIESLLLRELKRRQLKPATGYGHDDGRDRELLVELVATYAAAERWADVLSLVDRSSSWNAKDLADLGDVQDDANIPLAMHVARALAATGKVDAARRALESVIAANPGYDPAYAAYIELRGGSAAIVSFDAWAAQDPFEERPLLWKAIVLKDAGTLDAAAELARKAQAIDPSDGEERSPDRMRVYSVLADLLEARGDAATATIYRNAVKAIRVAEEGDQLRLAGLHTRAMQRYRVALDLFADAYCVQSRLAVELNKQGRHVEAEAHYRRAYELMPASFGRLESHCFGCEHVFEGQGPQNIAERVFTDLLRKTPEKPQVHYVMGYLRREQGRYAEAVQHQRDAVSRDNDYLSAWKQLDQLGDEIALQEGERDIAILRQLALDPHLRHVRPDLNKVEDLRGLYDGVAAARARRGVAKSVVYPLAAAAKELNASKSDESSWAAMAARMSFSARGLPTPAQAVANSEGLALVRAWLDLSMWAP